MPVPEAYYEYVMNYAPYIYVVPESGPDLTWGKAAFAAGFAVDFLFEAYFDKSVRRSKRRDRGENRGTRRLDSHAAVHG